MNAKTHNVKVKSNYEDKLYFSEKELSKMPSKCKDIKYGDFVSNETINEYRNNGLCIFDGTKLMNLDDNIDDYGNLPKKFKVLEMHPTEKFLIPVNYWHSSSEEDRSIVHNSSVWFDHKKYKKQLLENITYDANWKDKFELREDYENEKELYTSFSLLNLQSKSYYIVYENENEPSYEKRLQKFKKLLSSDKDLVFECLDTSSNSMYIVDSWGRNK